MIRSRHVCIGKLIGLLWIVTLVLASGCRTNGTTHGALCECRVIIDGRPAQDVRIVWKPKIPSSDVRLEGITDHSGVAGMHQVSGTRLNGSGAIEFRAAVESLGDWHIAKPWCDVDRSPLVIHWTPGTKSFDIELPKKAAQSL